MEFTTVSRNLRPVMPSSRHSRAYAIWRAIIGSSVDKGILSILNLRGMSHTDYWLINFLHLFCIGNSFLMLKCRNCSIHFFLPLIVFFFLKNVQHCFWLILSGLLLIFLVFSFEFFYFSFYWLEPSFVFDFRVKFWRMVLNLLKIYWLLHFSNSTKSFLSLLQFCYLLLFEVRLISPEQRDILSLFCIFQEFLSGLFSHFLFLLKSHL